MAVPRFPTAVAVGDPTADGHAATRGYVLTQAGLLIPLTQKGAASGVATLDSGTKIPIAQIPTGSTSTTVSLGNHTHSDLQATSAKNAASGYAGLDANSKLTESQVPLEGRVPLSLYSLLAVTAEHFAMFTDTYPLPKDEIQLNLIRLPAGKAITSVTTYIQVVGSGSPGNPGFQGFAVYDSSGTRVGVTTSDNTLFTSTGWRSKALTSPVAATSSDRWMYLGMLSNLPTGPTVRSSSDFGNAAFLNSGTQRRAFSNPSLTATPSSFTPSSYGNSDSILTLMGVL